MKMHPHPPKLIRVDLLPLRPHHCRALHPVHLRPRRHALRPEWHIRPRASQCCDHSPVLVPFSDDSTTSSDFPSSSAAFGCPMMHITTPGARSRAFVSNVHTLAPPRFASSRFCARTAPSFSSVRAFPLSSAEGVA